MKTCSFVKLTDASEKNSASIFGVYAVQETVLTSRNLISFGTNRMHVSLCKFPKEKYANGIGEMPYYGRITTE